jgi:hypothetical protein
VASWLRRGARQLSRTPGRVRLLGAVLVVALVALGLVAGAVLRERFEASQQVERRAAPALLAAADLYVALADADTTASRGFLEPGLEPAAVRQRYDAALQRAASLLTKLSASSRRLPAVDQDVTTLAAGLPEFNGLVESARANDRQRFVVGAAYLRQASALMRTELLPAAARLYADAARQLDREHDRGTARLHVVWLAVAAGATLLALLAAQVWLAGRFRRVLNVGLVAATTAVVASLVVVAVQLTAQENHVQRSRVEGSDVVELLSGARILTLRAHSDANLVLIERGTGDAYLNSYIATMERLGGVGSGTGLLGRTADHAEDHPGSVALAGVDLAHTAFTDVSRRIRELDGANQYESAVELALTEQAEAANKADTAYAAQIEVAKAHFDRSAAAAGTGLELVAVLAGFLALVAVILVVVGLRPRVREYR